MKTAFFPPKLLQALPSDNIEALAALCVEFEKLDGHARQMSEHHDDYVEALSILRGFAMVRDAKVPPDRAKLDKLEVEALGGVVRLMTPEQRKALAASRQNTLAAKVRP